MPSVIQRLFFAVLLSTGTVFCVSGTDAGSSVKASEGFQRVKRFTVERKPVEAFRSIAEHFQDVPRESYRSKALLRTDPEIRQGYYLMLDLNQPVNELPGSVLRLTYYQPSHGNRPRTVTYDLGKAVGNTGSRTLWLGLTGSEDLKPGEHWVAWQLEVSDGTSSVVLAQSYLWEVPPSAP